MEILSSRFLIRPRDRARTIDFYQRVLGLPVYREFGWDDTRGVVFFIGGGFLEISGSTDQSGSDASQLWLQVRDVVAVHRHLVRHGVVVDEPPTVMAWGLREMRARDPDERRLIFVEVPPDHPLRRDLRKG